MKQEEINKIMDNIMEDGNLCIVRNALENFKKETSPKIKENNIYVLCHDCQKSIKPNKIQINEYLIVDLCKDCKKKRGLK